MKNLKQPSIENLRTIGEVLYNIKGNEFYLNLVQFYYQSGVAIGTYKGRFFDVYREYLTEMEKEIANGAVFKYPLYNVGTKSNKPYIYNGLSDSKKTNVHPIFEDILSKFR